MLYIDTWKRVLIWAVCAAGLLLALPNAFYTRVEQSNDARAAIELGADTPENAAQASQWPEWMPSSLVNLGLDLRGGAHLLAEVNVEDVYASRMEAMWPEIRDALRDERATVGTIRKQPSEPDAVRVRISQPEGMSRALEVVRDLSRPIQSLTGAAASDIEVRAEGDEIVVTLSDAEKLASDDRTVRQALEIVRRRIDEVGTREPTIQRQGSDRILIQVPGIGSASELKDLIGTTAQLSFHPVVGRGTDAEANAGIGNKLLPSLDESGIFYEVEA
ncbi:protein translocase subunit SecD, partial [Cribrihabitans sp. XS_ASV171]